jgi:hypothetical protein
MHRTIALSILVSILSTPVVAKENLYDLKKIKTEKLFAVKSRNHIDVTPMEYYDKYLITVIGDGGFEHKFESDVPSISLYEMDELPYDGKYSYEIRAVRYEVEIKDTMNNGRSEDARGYISVINTVNGQFKAVNGEIEVYEEESEAKLSKLPIKPKPPINPFK